jgi:SnoaL-like domain
MADELPFEDRFRVHELLARYAWANDSANLEMLVGLFTPDAMVQPSTGERITVRQWAMDTFSHSGRRGRQHWVQPISIEPTANGCTARSYWKVVQWLAGPNTKTITAMGYYADDCVKLNGEWRIKEKRMYRCNDESALPW